MFTTTNNNDNSKNKKIAGIVKNIVCCFLLIVLVLQLLLMAILKNNYEDYFNLIPYRMLEVESDSMYPVLKTGDCIIVKQTAYDEIEIGDIISYIRGGILITHEVVEISNADSVITKGRQNEATDGVIEEKEYLGKMVLRIPAIGKILKYTYDPYTRGILIAIVVVALLGPELFSILYDLLFKKKAIDNNEKKE